MMDDTTNGQPPDEDAPEGPALIPNATTRAAMEEKSVRSFSSIDALLADLLNARN